MVTLLLVGLIVLWFLGYIRIDAFPIPDVSLFSINGQPITLWNLLIFIVVFLLIGLVPRPFREIAIVLLILWILSVLGILAFAGLSSLLVIAIIVGIVVSFFF